MTGPDAVRPRSRRFADRLAPWSGSIRFRLTLVYSVLLFGLAAAVVGGVYLSLARSLDDEPVSRTFVQQAPVLTPGGLAIEERTLRAEFQSLEELVNQRALDQLRDYSFAALGLLFAASMGVGWMVAGRVLAPIGRISTVARDIQATDLSRRINLDGPRDELRDLADTFDAMLGRLDEAFESQRRFVREASHELRNPLAVMRTNLDVTLADPDASVGDLRRTAQVVSRTTDRLSHLVDDLLAHARHGLPDRQWERVALDPVVEEIVAEFAAIAAARTLGLEAAPGASLSVMGDRTALRQALANLVDNAVRLAPSGSVVRLASGAEGGWAFLSVADAGPGIAVQDHNGVLAPLHRDRDHDDARRSGLGLSIVRQIAERHGGRVALASEPGVGSTFVVWLPLLAPTRPVGT